MHRRNQSLDKSTTTMSSGGGGFSFGSTPPLPPPTGTTTKSKYDDGHASIRSRHIASSTDFSQSSSDLDHLPASLQGGMPPLTPSTTASSVRGSQQYGRQKDSYFPPTPPASIRVASTPSTPRSHIQSPSQTSIASITSVPSRNSTPITALFSNQGAQGKKQKSAAASLRSRFTFSLGGLGGSGVTGNNRQQQQSPPLTTTPSPPPQHIWDFEDQQEYQRRTSVNSLGSDGTTPTRTPTSALDTTWMEESIIRRSDSLHTVRTDRTSVIYDQDVDFEQLDDMMLDDEGNLSDTGTILSYTPSLFQRKRKELEGSGIATGESTMLGEVMYVDGRLIRVRGDGTVESVLTPEGYSSTMSRVPSISEPSATMRPMSMQLPVQSTGGAGGDGLSVASVRRSPSSSSVSSVQPQIKRKPSPVTSTFPQPSPPPSGPLPEIPDVESHAEPVAPEKKESKSRPVSPTPSPVAPAAMVAQPAQQSPQLQPQPQPVQQSPQILAAPAVAQPTRLQSAPASVAPSAMVSPPTQVPQLTSSTPQPAVQQPVKSTTPPPTTTTTAAAPPPSPPRPTTPAVPVRATTPPVQPAAAVKATAPPQPAPAVKAINLPAQTASSPTPIVTTNHTPFNPITNHITSPFNTASPIPTNWGGGKLRMEISQVELPPTPNVVRPMVVESPMALYPLEKQKKRIDEEWEDEEDDDDNPPPPPYVARMSMAPGDTNENGFPVDEKAMLRRRSTLRRGSSQRRTREAIEAIPDGNRQENGTGHRPPTTPREAISPVRDSEDDARSPDGTLKHEHALSANPARKRSILKRASSIKRNDGLHRVGSNKAKIRFSHTAPEVISANYISTTPKSFSPQMGSSSTFKSPTAGPAVKQEPCRQCNESAAFTTMYRDLLTQERHSFHLERKIWEEERKALEKKVADMEAKIKRLLERRGIDVNEVNAEDGTFGFGNNIHRAPGSQSSYTTYGDSYLDREQRGKEKETHHIPEPWYNDIYPGALKDTGKEVVPSRSRQVNGTGASGSSSSSRPPATSTDSGTGSNKYWADFLDEFRLSSRCATIPSTQGLGDDIEGDDPRLKLPITEERAVYARLYAEASIGIGGPAMELLQ